MIYGRKQKHLESNKEYDYIACLYPEGNLRADKCVFFNNEDIAEIIHRGVLRMRKVNFLRINI